LIIKSICYKSDQKPLHPRKIKLKHKKEKPAKIKVQFINERDKLEVRAITSKSLQSL